eukprot:GEMP01070744.1.p1 GENE.GEMP01070744.1~~GEMP01070744.1.p1  ORF type:complete len:122 (-),score=11.77 GEMP01070744.1:205-570(-)
MFDALVRYMTSWLPVTFVCAFQTKRKKHSTEKGKNTTENLRMTKKKTKKKWPQQKKTRRTLTDVITSRGWYSHGRDNQSRLGLLYIWNSEKMVRSSENETWRFRAPLVFACEEKGYSTIPS